MSNPPFLSAADVHRLAPIGHVIEALRQAFATPVNDPPRAIVDIARPSQPDRVFLAMPAALDGAAGCKLITLFPDNVAQGQPAIQGIYVLFSARDGRVRALVDGATLTRLRTPAASALATDYLASPTATTLGIFGTGIQAEAHIEAMLAVRPSIRSVVVTSRSAGRASEFAASMTDRFGLAVQAGLAAEAAGSDIVCTCTTASAALFVADQLAPGAHVNAVGAFKPEHLEFGPDVVERSVVVVDDREAARAEAGDLIQAAASGRWGWSDVSGDLVDLVNGRVNRDAQDVTLFKSVGLSIEDLVVAKLAADLEGIAP
ncbi:MAG: ornithine cyclodeaminase family protein [Acidimicrobiales bacterium]